MARVSTISTSVAVTLGVEAVALTGLLALAADLWAHSRVENLAGTNIWGYRGPVLKVKQPGEVRLLVIGGDQAFGWGLAPHETMAAYLRRMVGQGLREPGDASAPPVTSATIGALGLPAREYAARIQRFADLGPDVVVLYPDLTESAAATMPPSDSFVAATTGYVPMIPFLLEDKGRALARDGWRAGGAVTRAGAGLRALDRLLCRTAWRCGAGADEEDRPTSLRRAIDAGLAAAPAVAVVLPLPRSEAEGREHDALRGLAEQVAVREDRVALADLAAHPELGAAALLLGGDRYGAQGQELVAAMVAPVVIALLRRSRVP